MLDQFETKNLFQLQTELIDRKIDMAASRSMDKVIDQINLSRAEFSQGIAKVREELNLIRIETAKSIEKVRDELNLSRIETAKSIEKVKDELKLSSKETTKSFEKVNEELGRIAVRVKAVETKLGIVNDRRSELRNRFLDYFFKAGWLGLAGVITLAFLHNPLLAKMTT